MPLELQESVQLGDCVFPDISTLTTPLSQEQVLQTLREHDVVFFKAPFHDNRRIRKRMSSLNTERFPGIIY